MAPTSGSASCFDVSRQGNCCNLVEEAEAAQGTQRYLLCYPGVLVDISFDWPPNEEQMALVGERLGGIQL